MQGFTRAVGDAGVPRSPEESRARDNEYRRDSLHVKKCSLRMEDIAREGWERVEGSALDVIALQKEPQLQYQELLEGQPPPSALCLLLAAGLMPAPHGLHTPRSSSSARLMMPGTTSLQINFISPGRGGT